jgi:hypothetical protein
MDVMGRKFKPLFPGELEEWEGQMWPNHEDISNIYFEESEEVDE